MSSQAGKGDTYRVVDQKKYGENYDRIFGEDHKASSTEKHSEYITIDMDDVEGSLRLLNNTRRYTY